PERDGPVGREVLARMRDEGMVVDAPDILNGGEMTTWGKSIDPRDGAVKWSRLDENDKAHQGDVVEGWDEELYKYGARSPITLAWMKDPNNYILLDTESSVAKETVLQL